MPPQSPADAVVVTPVMLRGWSLPRPQGDKEDRGRVLIVGGSAETPGAVLLAAEASLRSGAGKLQVATVASAAGRVAVALPEALVRGLAETPEGAIAPDSAAQVIDLARDASSVLVGPGMTDVDAVTHFLGRLLPELTGTVVVDAIAMARVTADIRALHHLGGRAVLTPNPSELAKTLGVSDSEVDEQPGACARRLAEAANAVVALGGTTKWVATPDGRLWQDGAGGAGLAASGTGDVRAGIVAGLVARGADPAQAAVWGSYLLGRAGDRLAGSVGRVGFLARELPPEVPRVLDEVEQ
jgi:ADP-dependent NAD(P)H-hydrate dehydratase